MFEKFTDGMERVLTPFANFMNGNKYISTIQDAFAANMPFIIIGSFALMFNLALCSTSSGLASISGFEWLADFSGIFTLINFACISCMALWIVFLIGYMLGEKNDQKPLICGIISVCCFVIMSNQDELTDNLGASALFLAIFVGFLSIALFSKLMTFEKIKIRLPESVPPMISASFNSLIPAFITIFVFGIVAGVFYTLTGMYVNDVIYNMLQAPFGGIVGTQLGVSIIIVMQQLLWWLGIHGQMAMNPVTVPVRTAALAANMAAVAAGSVPEEFYTMAFVHTFMNLGGGGIVISLALAILVFSKRDDYKQICKMGFVPLVFGISEPIVFGLPIMLNPTFLIPFVLAPLVTTNIGYLAIQMGFLTPAYVESISGAPMFLQQFLAFSGQWSSLVLVVIVVVVAFLIYAPFVIISNKQYERERAEAAQLEA